MSEDTQVAPRTGPRNRRWAEVNARLDPRRFTTRSAPGRLRRLGGDPAAPALTGRPDLLGALERLRTRLGAPAAR